MMLAAIVAAAAKDSAIFFVFMRITILYSEKSCNELNWVASYLRNAIIYTLLTPELLLFAKESS